MPIRTARLAHGLQRIFRGRYHTMPHYSSLRSQPHAHCCRPGQAITQTCGLRQIRAAASCRCRAPSGVPAGQDLRRGTRGTQGRWRSHCQGRPGGTVDEACRRVGG